MKLYCFNAASLMLVGAAASAEEVSLYKYIVHMMCSFYMMDEMRYNRLLIFNLCTHMPLSFALCHKNRLKPPI